MLDLTRGTDLLYEDVVQGYLLVGVVVNVSVAILREYPELGSHNEHLQCLQQELPRQLPREMDYYKIGSINSRLSCQTKKLIN